MADQLRLPLTSIMFVALVAGQLRAQTNESTIRFQGKAVHFADEERGRSLIGAADDFVTKLSDFDRAARLGSEKPVSQDAFLKHATQQVQAWDTADVKKFSKVIGRVDAQVRQFNLELSLPDEIVIVKTTGQEEAGPGAPYTRGTSIVMPGDVIKDGNDEGLFRLFLHELFHVMSRHNPQIRKPLYELIGFQSCNEIVYPQALLDRKLTNPDAFHFNSYLEVTIGDVPAKIVPLTLARDTTQREGGIMSNVSIEFLELQNSADKVSAKTIDGKPVLHAMSTIMGEYLKKIGHNTNYFIHPEEIMADNFAMAVSGRINAPNPEILDGVLKFFAK